jgi:hypothetical protein
MRTRFPELEISDTQWQMSEFQPVRPLGRWVMGIQGGVAPARRLILPHDSCAIVFRRLRTDEGVRVSLRALGATTYAVQKHLGDVFESVTVRFRPGCAREIYGAPIREFTCELKIPVQIADRTLPRVYVSVYDEQSLANNKLAALLDDRRTAPRDIYDLELLLARGICPSSAAVDNLGGRSALLKRVADKLDLMGWSLFRDEVLPTLPDELNAHIDEDEYLAMKLRLLDTLERCMAKPVGESGSP